MAPTPEPFAQAKNDWNLEKLYQDLAAAKTQFTGKPKQLTPVEMSCLRGLLCSYGSTEIAAQLNREPRGLRVDLSRGLYRYVEILTLRPLNTLKDWRDVAIWLEEAGYKIRLASHSELVNDSLIKIVDVSLEGDRKSPIVDLKVRNIGSQVAFLKSTKFLFSNAWVLKSWIVHKPEPDAVYSLVPYSPSEQRSTSRAVTPSYNYELNLPAFLHFNVDIPCLFEEDALDNNHQFLIDQSAYTQEFKISQCVACNDVDRFTFTLSMPKTSQQLISDRQLSYLIYTSYIYHFNLELVYDEDDKTVQSSPLILWLDPHWPQTGEIRYFFEDFALKLRLVNLPEEIKEYSRRNKKVISEISKIECQKSLALNRMIQQSYRLTEQNKHHGDEKQKNPSLLRRLFGEKL
ncbi:hypothetical protein [Microseira wollei]|uniref:Uncharacterized protein n=1 Tax=Microseira wollei NIES-4236 TaxID=2530354 RepID=A0AAV3X7I3_9CYAN|nr:hypothetical protein [Microseira wollei]GET35322.1 hypothetical protein MiSe_00640 [Microseira wollei NIES-4236]